MVTSKRGEIFGWGLLAAVVLFAVLTWVPKIEVYGLDQVLHPQKISRAFFKRDVFSQEDRARQTLATILGGLAVLAGTVMAWNNLLVARDNTNIARDSAETARVLAQRNADVAFKNLELAEDKQTTDRFTAAITNLSAESSNLAQRLGGLYALERIAREAPGEHHMIMDVLTAYVRNKRPIVVSVEQNTNNPEAPKVNGTVMPDDVKEIVIVIGRRDAKRDLGRPLNLSHTDLFQANLFGASLSDVDLSEANLSKADLRGAKLGGAYLSGADLSEADLSGADLGGVNLEKCLGLTQDQLQSANQDSPPKLLPSGLTFLGCPAPDPPLAPPT